MSKDVGGGNVDDAEARTESEEEFRVLFCKTKGERLK